MRTPLVLALIALSSTLAAACGDDQPPPPEEEAPAEESMEAPDTAAAMADTAAADTGMAADEEMAGETMDEPPRPATSADLPEGILYTVQMGAFVEAANASDYRQRLEEAGFPVWTEEARVAGRSFDRIRIGATPDMSRARRLGTLLEDRFGREVWITTVGSRDRLPTGILESTRRVLEGS